MWKPVVCVTALAAAMICTEVLGQTAAPKDGELPLPDYKSWDVFLKDVQKPDTKQIRDIYINAVGAGVDAGSPLPDGSSLVMEIYAATEADGGLAKGDLSKVFVMTKQAGWGGNSAIPNGGWVYGAFEADGSAAQVDYNTCRSCHVPVAADDFVHKLGDYIAAR